MAPATAACRQVSCLGGSTKGFPHAEGIDAAPEIRIGEYLVSVDGNARDLDLPGVQLTWLESTGFHRTTPYRGIGVATRNQAEALCKLSSVTLYRPITARQGPLY